MLKKLSKLIFGLTLIFFGSVFCLFAYASVEGARDCGTGADDAAVGTTVWATVADGCGSNNVRVTTAMTGTAQSHYFKSTNFGFATIPNTARVKGIQVTYEHHGDTSGANNVDDVAVRLVDETGAIGGTNRATAGTDWPTVTDSSRTFGGTTDTWGDTWTASDIKDVDFGAVITVKGATGSGSKTVNAFIDNVTITVTYKDAGRIHVVSSHPQTFSVAEALSTDAVHLAVDKSKMK